MFHPTASLKGVGRGLKCGFPNAWLFLCLVALKNNLCKTGSSLNILCVPLHALKIFAYSVCMPWYTHGKKNFKNMDCINQKLILNIQQLKTDLFAIYEFFRYKRSFLLAVLLEDVYTLRSVQKCLSRKQRKERLRSSAF